MLAPFAIVGLSVASYGHFWNNQPWRGGLLAGTAAITALFSLTKAFVTVRQQLRRESTHELLGCLHVLHALMTAGDDDDEPHDLRIAFHVPVDDGRYLEQATEYVYGNDGGRPPRKGRKLTTNSGVIGKAYREKAAICFERENDNAELFVRELQEKFNFTEQDARAVNPTRVACLAVPVTDGDHVHGVLYMDVLRRGFFNPERQTLAIEATKGVSRFARLRYD